jgi:MFS family permease
MKKSSVLWLLSSLSMITYLDRLCISVAGPRMQEELGLTPAQWGWIMGAFVLGYGAFEMPLGALGDRMGQRKVIARIVVWWSGFTTLTGMMSGFYSLVTTRFLFGVGEAGAYPNISGVISRWFPITQRARAQGCVWAASRLGGAMSSIIVVPVMVLLGWRAMFYLFGVIGLIWVVVWLVRYRDPAMEPAAGGPAGSDTAIRHSLAGVPWRRLFQHRQIRRIMIMYSCYVWGSTFYLSWFHTYLVRGRGLTETEMGLFASLPFVMGIIGNLSGGWMADRLCQRYGLKIGRRLMGSSCLAVTSLLLCATALTPDKITAIVLLTLGFGVMDCMLSSAWSLCLDVGGHYAGAVSGAMNTAGHVGGFACSVLFGYIVKETGSYDMPLFLIATMVALSAYLFSRIDPTEVLGVDAAPGPAPATV